MSVTGFNYPGYEMGFQPALQPVALDVLEMPSPSLRRGRSYLIHVWPEELGDQTYAFLLRNFVPQAHFLRSSFPFDYLQRSFLGINDHLLADKPRHNNLNRYLLDTKERAS